MCELRTLLWTSCMVLLAIAYRNHSLTGAFEKRALPTMRGEGIRPSSDRSSLLTPLAVADRLGCSLSTLANWRCIGRGPPFVKFGTTQQAPVRYRESDLDQWIAANWLPNTSFADWREK